jgi:hypothetical protein
MTQSKITITVHTLSLRMCATPPPCALAPVPPRHVSLLHPPTAPYWPHQPGRRCAHWPRRHTLTPPPLLTSDLPPPMASFVSSLPSSLRCAALHRHWQAVMVDCLRVCRVCVCAGQLLRGITTSWRWCSWASTGHRHVASVCNCMGGRWQEGQHEVNDSTTGDMQGGGESCPYHVSLADMHLSRVVIQSLYSLPSHLYFTCPICIFVWRMFFTTQYVWTMRNAYACLFTSTVGLRLTKILSINELSITLTNKYMVLKCQ